MSSPAEVQPFKPRGGPDSGQILGDRYRLLEERGHGGFATVYHAHDRKLDTAVAIKLLHVEPDERTRRRFELEIESGSRIVHPHIVRIMDRGEHDRRPYAVMPLLHGTTLWHRRGADHRQVCRWMRQYLDGMRALHEARAFAVDHHRTRLLHRDIKPSNCFVSTDGHLTIIDFGLVKSLDHDARTTTQGMLVGSPAYMAPECIFGGAATEQSDVYSLGVSFFEMLTGERPYSGDLAGLNAIHVQLRPPPSPRALRPELPIALAELVQHAMAPLPAARPATVAVMLRRLDRIMRSLGEPAPATPRVPTRPALVLVPPPDLVAPEPPPTSRRYLILLLSIIAVTLVTIIFYIHQNHSSHPSAWTIRSDDPPDHVTPLDILRPSQPPPAPSIIKSPNEPAAPRVPLTQRLVEAAVQRHAPALRRCPDFPSGFVPITLTVADGHAALQRVRFQTLDPRDPWHRCAARVLAALPLSLPPGAGTFDVRADL